MQSISRGVKLTLDVKINLFLKKREKKSSLLVYSLDVIKCDKQSPHN
ncbi:MAG: hypothetical protein LEGION0398_MBIBDBAK_00184 [Legionellaceae bacterium]